MGKRVIIIAILLGFVVTAYLGYGIGRSSVQPEVRREIVEVPIEVIKEVEVPGPERIVEKEIIIQVPEDPVVAEEPQLGDEPGRGFHGGRSSFFEVMWVGNKSEITNAFPILISLIWEIS